MLFNKNVKYKDIIILILLIAAGYIFTKNYQLILGFARGFLSNVTMFIYGLLIAYALNPLMKFFQKRLNIKKGLAIALTYVIISGLIVLIFRFGLPSIIDSIISLTSEIPKYIEIIQGWINSALKNEALGSLIKDVGILDYLTVLSSKFGTILIGILQDSISSIFAITTNLVKFILGFILSIYVLIDKEKFIAGAKTITYMVLKEEKGNRFIEWVRIYHKMVGLYIGTKAIDSSIIGAISFITMLIIKAPYPGLIALFVGVTNMVPYVGPLVGEIFGAFVGIFVSPMKALTIFLCLLAIQQFDGFYLDPKLIGGKVGVRPFFIILGLTIGGSYFGVVGMLLASPTMATLKILYDRRVAAFKARNSYLIKYIEKNELKTAEDTKNKG